MAKKKVTVIRLMSMAGTGFFYTTNKNPKLPTKLFLRKYDPVLGAHTIFKEEKISRRKK